MFVTMVDNRFRSDAYISTLRVGIEESIMLPLLVSIDVTILWLQQTVRSSCSSSKFNGIRLEPTNISSMYVCSM